MNGGGRHCETKPLPYGRGLIEVGNEMPEVIETELARRRALALGDSHVALI
jgi:hypothetical protein